MFKKIKSYILQLQCSWGVHGWNVTMIIFDKVSDGIIIRSDGGKYNSSYIEFRVCRTCDKEEFAWPNEIGDHDYHSAEETFKGYIGEHQLKVYKQVLDAQGITLHRVDDLINKLKEYK